MFGLTCKSMYGMSSSPASSSRSISAHKRRFRDASRARSTRPSRPRTHVYRFMYSSDVNGSASEVSRMRLSFMMPSYDDRSTSTASVSDLRRARALAPPRRVVAAPPPASAPIPPPAPPVDDPSSPSTRPIFTPSPERRPRAPSARARASPPPRARANESDAPRPSVVSAPRTRASRGDGNDHARDDVPRPAVAPRVQRARTRRDRARGADATRRRNARIGRAARPRGARAHTFSRTDDTHTARVSPLDAPSGSSRASDREPHGGRAREVRARARKRAPSPRARRSLSRAIASYCARATAV